QVAGAVARVRMRRVLPLAAPHDVLRAWKAGTQAAAGVALRESTRMVEVQMRREHDVDVLGGQTGLRERVIEMPRAVHTVDVLERCVLLVAEPGVYDHGSHAADDQWPHRERDAIARVRGRSLLPQRLRDHTEHRAAVQTEEPITDGDQLKIADRVPRD